MNAPDLILIIAIEVAVVLLVICGFLLFQNRSLRRLVAALKERTTAALTELKRLKAEQAKKPPPAPPPPPEIKYLEYIDTQISATHAHHASLSPTQDIALDISPEQPLPLRTAALRHAMLLAEKEAGAGVTLEGGEADWVALRERYEQIYSFFSEFGQSQTVDESEADALRVELENARKRIHNLERFKQLYFDLEAQWQSSKQEALTHFEQLSELANQSSDPESFDQVLQSYHNSYTEITRLFEQGPEGDLLSVVPSNQDLSSEVRHLRAVAEDQHKIIKGLQDRLRDADSDDERNQIVDGLQGELQKQLRFVQESETCIQLLEDELAVANKDLELLKGKLSELPGVKTEALALQKNLDELELKYHAVLSENQKLKRSAASEGGASAGSSEEEARLRKELSAMETRYNELEEKFLDLKLLQ